MMSPFHRASQVEGKRPTGRERQHHHHHHPGGGEGGEGHTVGKRGELVKDVFHLDPLLHRCKGVKRAHSSHDTGGLNDEGVCEVRGEGGGKGGG